MGKSKDLATGAAYQDQTESDTRYVNASGDTVTGNLNVSHDVTAEPYSLASFQNTKADGSGHAYGGVVLNGYDQAHLRFLTNQNTWNGSGGKQWQIRVGAGNGQDNMHIYSWTKADDVLKINSSGHVQIPHQPAWCLQPNHTTTSYIQGDTQIPFVSGVGSFGTFIQGGVTANSSGRVTIPVSGKYFCHVSFRQENVSTNMQLSIWKNGTYIVRGGIWYNSEVYENISIARTFDLAANDYLEVKINLGNANNIAGYNDRLTFFSGFMIG